MAIYWVDLLIIGIILLSIVTGFIRGFVKELIAIAIWLLALWLAFTYTSYIANFLKDYIQGETTRSISSFIIIFLAALIVGGLLNAVFNFILQHTGLKGPDRILGMGFGFLRGVFIVALIMLVIRLTSMPYQEYSKKSLLYANFNPVVDWLYDKMPDLIKKVNTEKQNSNALDFGSAFEIINEA